MRAIHTTGDRCRNQINTIVAASHSPEHFRRITFWLSPLPSAVFPSVFAIFCKHATGTSVALHIAHENPHRANPRAPRSRVAVDAAGISADAARFAIDAEATYSICEHHAADVDAHR